MGDTYAGGGYYCSVSEHANACVRPGAALFSSWVNLTVLMAAPVPGKVLLGHPRARVRLCMGVAQRVHVGRYLGLFAAVPICVWVGGRIGLLICGG